MKRNEARAAERWKHPPRRKPGKDRNRATRAKLLGLPLEPWLDLVAPRVPPPPPAQPRALPAFRFDWPKPPAPPAPDAVRWPEGTHRVALPDGSELRILPLEIKLQSVRIREGRFDWISGALEPYLEARITVLDVESGRADSLTLTHRFKPEEKDDYAGTVRRELAWFLEHEVSEAVRRLDGTAVKNPHPDTQPDDYVPRALRPAQPARGTLDAVSFDFGFDFKTTAAL